MTDAHGPERGTTGSSQPHSVPAVAPIPTVAVGGIVVVDDHILLVSRANPPARGLWTVPGGKVEPGERLTEAVEREVMEETGLRVVCGPLIGWVERIGDGYHFVILDFRATVVQGAHPVDNGLPIATAGDDAGAVRWVALDRLNEMDIVPGLLQFLAEHSVIRQPSGG